MAESIGLIFAIGSLVLQLGEVYKKTSADIHYLKQDLKTFKNFLVLSKDVLPPTHHLRTACEELVIDFELLLSKQGRRRPWQQALTLGSREISSLRERLNFQMYALQGRHNICRDSFSVSGQPLVDKVSLSSGVLELSDTSTCSTGTEYAAISMIATTTNNAMARASLHSLPSSSSAPFTVSNRLSSAESFCSDATTSDRLSLRSSNRSTSTYTIQTEASSISDYDELGRSETRTATVDRHCEGTCCRADDVVDTHLHDGATRTHTNTLCGRTPLIQAIIDGRKELVDTLLNEGAGMKTRDRQWGWTPLIWAVMEDKLDILELLIRKGANLTVTDPESGRSPLLWAASIGNRVAAELLLWRDPRLISTTDNEGMTPLALAYDSGHLETAELFIERGDNLDFVFRTGHSLLTLTIFAKHERLAHLLLEHGANARSIDKTRLPPLIIAIQQNLPDVAKLLVAKGADVHCTDDSGTPSLILAIKEGQFDTAEMLLGHRSNVEARDGDGNTALYWAIRCETADIVKCLMQHNASITMIDGDGTSAQQWASWIGNTDIIKILPAAAIRSSRLDSLSNVSTSITASVD